MKESNSKAQSQSDSYLGDDAFANSKIGRGEMPPPLWGGDDSSQNLSGYPLQRQVDFRFSTPQSIMNDVGEQMYYDLRGAGRSLGDCGPHYYELDTAIYLHRDGSEQSIEQVAEIVFEEMRRYPAPGGDGHFVSEGGTPIDLVLGGVNVPGNRNPIISTANVAEKSVQNVTQNGHVFHPGTITRRLVIEGNQIHIHTVGEGEGCLATINEVFGEALFRKVDGVIRERVQARL